MREREAVCVHACVIGKSFCVIGNVDSVNHCSSKPCRHLFKVYVSPDSHMDCHTYTMYASVAKKVYTVNRIEHIKEGGIHHTPDSIS